MVRDVISALPWGGDPTFRKPRNVGHPLAERLIVTLASFHRALGSLFPRCTSLLLPSLFVHAEHEEPHDQLSCPEKAEGCKVGEQTVAERPIQEGQTTQT